MYEKTSGPHKFTNSQVIPRTSPRVLKLIGMKKMRLYRRKLRMGGVYQELVGEGTNDPRTCRFEEGAEQGSKMGKRQEENG